MGKIAFVFSGQGDQHPGMGRAMFDQYDTARSVYAICDQMRPNTSKQCFEGSAEELQQTQNTQPCLFAMEMATAMVLKQKGVQADAAAGFSLGEVAAATYAGIFDLETGFQLVCRRGEIMAQAAAEADTAMGAVLKLSDQQVFEICRRFESVYPVNFNCPGQISVSGLSTQMPKLAEAVRAAGGRLVPLKVKGAFHSPFMNEAAKMFSKALEHTEIRENEIPMYSNLTAREYDESPKELLTKQICHPVQWELLVKNMIADGADQFIEIGPGKTLCNMIRNINPAVQVWNATEYLEELER